MEQKYKALIYSTYKDVYFEKKMEFTQHDSKTAKILFECYDDINVPMTDIQYAVLNIRRPDGKAYTFGMSYDGNPVFEINNNNVLLILPPAALYIAGKKYEGSVALHGTGGKRLTVARFTYDVIEDMISDTPIDETNEFPILTELIDDVTILKDAYKGALENNVNGEVIAARKGERLLGDRLDKIDLSLAEKASQQEVNEKFNQVNSQLADIAYLSIYDNNDMSIAINQMINEAISKNLKTVKLPYKAEGYTCKSTIEIDISKINVDFNNNTLDFSNITNGQAGLHIFSSAIYDSWSPKHKVKNFTINKKYGDYSFINMVGIKIGGTGSSGNANFRLENFQIQSCKTAIYFDYSSWRISIDNGQFRWNDTSVLHDTAGDCGENIHFTSCMFADGNVGVNSATNIDFQNCSFDNVTNIISHYCTFTHCHFEFVNPDTTTINKPFVTIKTVNGFGIFKHCMFITNGKTLTVAPFKLETTIYHKALVLDTCYCAIDSNTWGDVLIDGVGLCDVINPITYWHSLINLPYARSLNVFRNPKFVNTNDIVFTKLYGSGDISAVSVDTTNYKNLGNTIKAVIPVGVDLAIGAEIDTVSPKLILSFIKLYIDNISGTAKIGYMIEFYDKANNIITLENGHSRYATLNTTDTLHILRAGEFTPANAVKCRIVLQLLNGGGSSDLVVHIVDMCANCL